ncbi:rhomboid family intramembrane serine protease [Pararhizobium haloflavum]|uniref:rhomboid family intramembrane serine protease n=1 Tax=Pararhizobium haloflavum TaxID=2037914 RepID=UPI000C17FD3A|nr:rhomboid family intramembrane serine protease [Pararhizobium haloflavum]
MQEALRERPREPIFNLPRIVLIFMGIVWAVHLARVGLLDRGQDLRVIVETAFIPLRYAVPLSDQSPAWLWSPVTYSFLHGSFAHLIVNSVWMAAFGAVVARRIGTARFCAFWIATSVAAVTLHLALHWGEEIPVIGASGVVSGLMGAAARFAFPENGRFRRDKAHFLPRLSIAESLTNRTVLIYLGIWFGINALAALGFGGDPSGTMDIAWEAHIGGFLCGFLLFAVFDRRDWH